MSEEKIELVHKHSLWLRWLHWIHFPVLMLMILSGLQIYWANDIYTRSFLDRKLFNYLGLDHKLADGMYLHFTLAWILVANAILYIGYLLASGEWRELLPEPRSFRQAIVVLLHDLGLSKNLPPQGKFNAAQRIAYTSVLFIGFIAIVSGIAIYKPVQLLWLTRLFFGYEGARLIHFGSMLSLLGFFCIHLAQVIRSGWNNFQAMITGFEVKNEPKNKSQ